MRRALTVIATAGLLAGVPTGASAHPAVPQARADSGSARIARLIDRARHSKYLWATVNVCTRAHSGGTIGVRGEMPGLGIRATLSITIRLNYYSTARKTFVPLPGATATRTVTLGTYRDQVHQGGASFPFSADPGRLDASVTFTWSRGSTALGAVTETTTGGHPQAAYSKPAHHSAAACRIG